MKEYYLLSLKWSGNKDRYLWWGPNNSGYFEDLDKAGIYTEEIINSKPLYYKNRGVVPIQKEIVEGLYIQRVVPTTSDNWKLLNIDLSELIEY